MIRTSRETGRSCYWDRCAYPANSIRRISARFRSTRGRAEPGTPSRVLIADLPAWKLRRRVRNVMKYRSPVVRGEVVVRAPPWLTIWLLSRRGSLCARIDIDPQRFHGCKRCACPQCGSTRGRPRPDHELGGRAPVWTQTHVYVAPEDLDQFVASFVATFGGTASVARVTSITPTPSAAVLRFILSPVGALSIFAFKTPIPYPFGAERTGYLVTDLDAAVRAAQADGADVIVAPFPDPIGRDAVIQWPGGVDMQLYSHISPPSYDRLQTIPENRVYLSAGKSEEFIKDFLQFSHGKVVSDDAHAPGVEIGRPNDTYRSVKLESLFGKMNLIISDGHLPYPYGRELMGYEVATLADTLDKARASGVMVLVAPYTSRGRQAAVVQFPGGYITEIHATNIK